jgi:hypothetical protein
MEEEHIPVHPDMNTLRKLWAVIHMFEPVTKTPQWIDDEGLTGLTAHNAMSVSVGVDQLQKVEGQCTRRQGAYRFIKRQLGHPFALY